MIGSDCLEKLGDQDEHDFMVFNRPRFVIHHLQYNTVSTLNSKQQVQYSAVEIKTPIFWKLIILQAASISNNALVCNK